MNLAADIVQSLMLPKLEKDASFDAKQTNIDFWETFATDLIDFEKDAIPVYAVIYSLELNNPEKIISKLDNVYHSFIKELAENYVLGYSSDIINTLLKSENSTFEKEIQFFHNLEKAIIKSERKRIKTALPNLYEELTFELSDTEIDNAIKKTSREDLKKKMIRWDNDLMEEKSPTIKLEQNNTSKVISLYWVKYAVAACFVLGFGIWFYTNQNQSIMPENNVVITPDKEETPDKTDVVTSIPVEALAEVTVVNNNSTVLEDGMGMTANSIRVIENNQKARKASIVFAIEKYQKLLEKQFPADQVGFSPIKKELESRIEKLKEELNLLNEKEQRFLFDGKVLTLYVSTASKENRVLIYNDNYYLAKDTVFYTLNTSSKSQSYVKVTDAELLTALDKILN